MPLRVLVLEPEPAGQSLLADHAEAFGHRVHTVASAEDMLAWLAQDTVDVVLLRCALPGEATLQRIQAARLLAPAAELVIIADSSAVRTAVDAVRAGAHGYVEEPYRVDALEVAIQRAGIHAQLRRDHAGLRFIMQRSDGPVQFIGNAPALLEAVDHASRVAPTNAPVVITGEAGTGKHLLARYIHAQSSRAHHPFVTVRCAGRSGHSLMVELFGVEDPRGRRAGHVRPGLIHTAAGGTLCLAGIAALPIDVQARLQTLLEQEDAHSGPRRTDAPIPIRVIATSTADLRERVEMGAFRPDLFYHLNSMELRLPPLRDRPDDLPPLVRHFLAHAPLPATARRVTAEALETLAAYDWPGNLWELRNVIERAAALATTPELEAAAFPPLLPRRGANPHDALPLRLAHAERQHIERVLSHYEGNKTRAAAALGITTKTLYNKLKAWSRRPASNLRAPLETARAQRTLDQP